MLSAKVVGGTVVRDVASTKCCLICASKLSGSGNDSEHPEFGNRQMKLLVGGANISRSKKKTYPTPAAARPCT